MNPIKKIREAFKRVYVVRGTFWRIKELTYEEDGMLRELWKQYVDLSKEKELSDVIDTMYSSGSLEKLFTVVLKPLPLLGSWNWIVCHLQGFTRQTTIRKMTNSAIARVVADFFVVNGSWISNYLSFAGISISDQEKLPLMDGKLFIKNPFFKSPTATLSKQKES